MSQPYKRNRSNFNKPQRGGDRKGAVVSGNEDANLPHNPVQAQPLEVVIGDGNFDRAFRLFRSLVQIEGVIAVYKDRRCFEKPSVKKRRKRAENQRKRMELAHKQERQR